MANIKEYFEKQVNKNIREASLFNERIPKSILRRYTQEAKEEYKDALERLKNK